MVIPMMRKLASIQRVTNIRDIPNKDLIATANVMGWQVIIRKEDFSEGDLCVFFEIDSVLPEAPWSAFTKGKPIKTMKMSGVISQGLAMPLSVLVSGAQESVDVTELLGITKKEDPLPSQPKGNHERRVRTFPNEIPRTDEPRVESHLKLLNALMGKPYYITVKCDGTSATYLWNEELGEVTSCSRNYIVDTQPYIGIAEDSALKEKLSSRPHLVIQGEICGPTIQHNRLGLGGQRLFVYNLYDKTTREYLSYEETTELCDKWGLEMVPLVEKGDSFSYTLPELKELAKGAYPSGFPREGIVVRSSSRGRPSLSPHDEEARISFKVISTDYLLAI